MRHRAHQDVSVSLTTPPPCETLFVQLAFHGQADGCALIPAQRAPSGSLAVLTGRGARQRNRRRLQLEPRLACKLRRLGIWVLALDGLELGNDRQ